ncbi:hypothetical protein [Anaerocolumna chitinilytica]|uniref:Uncharacterized protein n=1 Tax=Anaerocolumna chitinilytica TaxID=1727145 RepID=A0A7I8DPJ9_9FIRM|nr:hypothetical protein [Anaerocolumna chitinilytica]BCK00320.1 hypothetical protein bsdcttw_33600 [Anaerocolumna chitinilytica]
MGLNRHGLHDGMESTGVETRMRRSAARRGIGMRRSAARREIQDETKRSQT